MSTEKKSNTDFIDLGELNKKLDLLSQAMDHAKEQTNLGVDVMSRQTRMLEIALDVMLKLVSEGDVAVNVRRRLNFALQQIRGIGIR